MNINCVEMFCNIYYWTCIRYCMYRLRCAAPNYCQVFERTVCSDSE